MLTQHGLEFLAGENTEATIIDSLTLDHYHSICWQFSEPRSMSSSAPVTVNIGSAIVWAAVKAFDAIVDIAHLQSLDPEFYDWSIVGHWVMENGWRRVDSSDAVNTTISIGFWWSMNKDSWLSQANHIFSKLQLASNFQDYVVLTDIYFILTISATEADTPAGFLFLCPPSHFRTGKFSFKRPECPAYWSLDPSGANRLTMKDAVTLGFPSFNLTTHIMGSSWDASVYAGLRQFHQAKGFDPDSQDLARYLGHKLYQLSDLNPSPFAHIDNEDSGITRDDPPTTSAQQGTDELPVSSTLRFIMIVQLSLILFQTLCGVFKLYQNYDGIRTN
ncbi:hypothetical protein MSAN_00293500 [Mycena sanguinolenta]|uniref:Uncharacterized protein n=1 Tax=Mycena sanguinolenta TaxID=230812 RepID=A0A8H6Z880_9AGAR|nr:hypothetical protein MSAN_00293500 [Mycena sanguinolenta]